ncbi:Bgt-50858 [Blumeria graminis f. sp. tritici]|uniref:Bgt-50858 n=1 Tax=Blumeria graminis f. sp. tritici TaxID=62690 RepID=A0A9X9QE56_BLUGR|nr:Bgt-50858 [Blumeria graminis f. sp. tritici]
MNANLVLALLSKHPHLMYIELAVVTPISPSIANLSYIPKATSLPFSYLVITGNLLH